MSQFQQPPMGQPMNEEDFTPDPTGEGWLQNMQQAGGAMQQRQPRGGGRGRGRTVNPSQAQMRRMSEALNSIHYPTNPNAGYPTSSQGATSKEQYMDNLAGNMLGVGNNLPGETPGVVNAAQAVHAAELSEMTAQRTLMSSLLFEQTRAKKSMDDMVKDIGEAGGVNTSILSALLGGIKFANEERMGNLIMSDTIANKLSGRYLDDLSQSFLGSQVTAQGTRAESAERHAAMNRIGIGGHPDAHVVGDSSWSEWSEMVQAIQREGEGVGSRVRNAITASPLNYLFGMTDAPQLSEGSFGSGGVMDNELMGITQFLHMAKQVNAEAGDITRGIVTELGWNSDRVATTSRLVQQLQDFNYDIYATNSSVTKSIRDGIKLANERGGDKSLAEQKMVAFYSNLLGTGPGSLSSRGDEGKRMRMNSERYQENWQNYQDYVADILEAHPEEARLALQISGQMNEHLGSGLKNKYSTKSNNAEAAAAYRETLAGFENIGVADIEEHVSSLRSQYRSVAEAANMYGKTHAELGAKYHVNSREYGQLHEAMAESLNFYGNEIAYDNPDKALQMLGSTRERILTPELLDGLAELGMDPELPETQELISILAPAPGVGESYYEAQLRHINDGVRADGKVPVMPDPTQPWQIGLQVMALKTAMKEQQQGMEFDATQDAMENFAGDMLE